MSYLTAQQMISIEEQLDIWNDLCTWFGTAPDITVQEFADDVNRCAREEALLEPLDFETEIKQVIDDYIYDESGLIVGRA